VRSRCRPVARPRRLRLEEGRPALGPGGPRLACRDSAERLAAAALGEPLGRRLSPLIIREAGTLAEEGAASRGEKS
jgi:hypothetical protein